MAPEAKGRNVSAVIPVLPDGYTNCMNSEFGLVEKLLMVLGASFADVNIRRTK